LKSDTVAMQEGELIGYLQIIQETASIPYISYMLKNEYCGKGYGTEFLQTFITYLSSLPKKQVLLIIDPKVIDFKTSLTELCPLTATTDINNLASQALLKKTGFNLISIDNDEDRDRD
jgi:RimJ/RimL family protein N-acetyltransferase